MKTYILTVTPIGAAKAEWVAAHENGKKIAEAHDALVAVGAYGLEIRTIINGILGQPIYPALARCE